MYLIYRQTAHQLKQNLVLYQLNSQPMKMELVCVNSKQKTKKKWARLGDWRSLWPPEHRLGIITSKNSYTQICVEMAVSTQICVMYAKRWFLVYCSKQIISVCEIAKSLLVRRTSNTYLLLVQIIYYSSGKKQMSLT